MMFDTETQSYVHPAYGSFAKEKVLEVIRRDMKLSLYYIPQSCQSMIWWSKQFLTHTYEELRDYFLELNPEKRTIELGSMMHLVRKMYNAIASDFPACTKERRIMFERYGRSKKTTPGINLQVALMMVATDFLGSKCVSDILFDEELGNSNCARILIEEKFEGEMVKGMMMLGVDRLLIRNEFILTILTEGKRIESSVSLFSTMMRLVRQNRDVELIRNNPPGPQEELAIIAAIDLLAETPSSAIQDALHVNAALIEQKNQVNETLQRILSFSFRNGYDPQRMYCGCHIGFLARPSVEGELGGELGAGGVLRAPRRLMRPMRVCSRCDAYEEIQKHHRHYLKELTCFDLLWYSSILKEECGRDFWGGKVGDTFDGSVIFRPSIDEIILSKIEESALVLEEDELLLKELELWAQGE